MLRSRQPTLVFGDDGSPPSDLAWEWLNLHSWPDWDIEVLTAHFEEGEIDWGEPPRLEPWQPDWARPLSPGIGTDRVRFLSVAADPRVMLAERADADLMMVGVRPRNPLEARWMGSTTEWLLQHPPAPLAVIRRPSRVQRVAVCLDGSDHSLAALRAFAALPLAAAAQITGLVVDDGRVDAAAAVEAAGDALRRYQLEARWHTAQGRPTTEILEYLQRNPADLVVLGTRGLTGWRRLRLGSTAAAVVRAAGSSCLVASVEDDAVGTGSR